MSDNPKSYEVYRSIKEAILTLWNNQIAMLIILATILTIAIAWAIILIPKLLGIN